MQAGGRVIKGSHRLLRVGASLINHSYYSIRMRADACGRHISGAERITTEEQIDATVSGLVSRAMSKDSKPGRITITVESLRGAPRRLTALEITTAGTDSLVENRSLASTILLQAGVSGPAIHEAGHMLSNGPGPGGENMRGAMIVDAVTGKRLEPDPARGVRASRFDWSEDASSRVREMLSQRGLSHFRTYEALALATKIANGPGVLAELCWSDDPGYTAGYVASLRAGYVRFPRMKNMNDGKGGRAIFVDANGQDITPLIDYLQNEPVLIDMSLRSTGL